jgi:hypothetical protein
MLASITPLGERARGSRWTVSVTAFLIASSLGGASLGGAVGLLGKFLRVSTLSWSATAWTAAALTIVALAFDSHWFQLRLPTTKRQVNEQWLDHFRGWVYGAGFGLQLGLGAVTVVTTAATYLCFALGFLSASGFTGMIMGATFGATRGATVFAVAGVRRPDQVPVLGKRLARWDRPSRVATLWALGCMALVAGTGAVIGGGGRCC